MAQENAPRLVVVAVATYRRPSGLAHLLTSLAQQNFDRSRWRIEVVVVDNDDQPSASVREFPDAILVHEKLSGIVHARNRGVLEALKLQPWAIAFIDDDECAHPTWLESLSSALCDTGAAVATGPVDYQLPSNREYLRPGSIYFESLERSFGETVTDIATNNTLVLATCFTSSEIWFDSKYSDTGGSDKEFFARLTAAGYRGIWVPTARVTEVVPAERATSKWLRQRDLRNGQINARLMMDSGARRAHVWMLGLARVAKGAVADFFTPKSHRNEASRGRTKATGRGWMRAASGSLYREYARRQD